jgi:hypothetical protein
MPDVPNKESDIHGDKWVERLKGEHLLFKRRSQKRIFNDVRIGETFSFTSLGHDLTERHGYKKTSARGWEHPTYGKGRVGSTKAEVENEKE